jgi:hypothetical protein
MRESQRHWTAAQRHWLSVVSHALGAPLSVCVLVFNLKRRAVDVNRPVRLWYASAVTFPTRLRTLTETRGLKTSFTVQQSGGVDGDLIIQRRFPPRIWPPVLAQTQRVPSTSCPDRQRGWSWPFRPDAQQQVPGGADARRSSRSHHGWLGSFLKRQFNYFLNFPGRWTAAGGHSLFLGIAGPDIHGFQR